ncbi:MAG: sigma-E processing peptidase SpoIIGA [Oscillospiraceae bacterium]|jgi:stage II sporulation protein GA (sporulation sigma-E factor processing peptidase)|nr:sigma-E processing peptidase SpoIIGA [Oscillospiraceae bacterium]
MRVLYIDELFLINLAADYFLLLGTAKLCGVAAKRRRLALGAVIGAVYAVVAALPRLELAAHPVFRVLSAAVMLLCSFGLRKKLLRYALVFFALSAAAAGAVAGLELAGGGAVIARVNLGVFAVAFLACYAVITLIFRRVARSGAQYAKLAISLGDRTITLRALIDTGNTLRDPVSDRAAAIAPASEIAALFPRDMRKRLLDALRMSPIDALPLLDFTPVAFRLLTYDAVGIESGALLCFIPDDATVDGAPRELIVAVSPNELADNVAYAAIISNDE